MSLINFFKNRKTVLLFLFAFFSIALFIAKAIYTQNLIYSFLLWNLFLAIIPWFISSLITYYKINNKFILVFVSLLWLAFFPNAPYILTDLIHLGKDHTIPRWYELIMLLSFALAGTFFGFVSLSHIQEILKGYFNKIASAIVIVMLIYIAGFAIYIGRFLRFNSWDLITNLNDIFEDTYKELTNPNTNIKIIGFILIFGTLLNLLYWFFRSLNIDPEPKSSSK